MYACNLFNPLRARRRIKSANARCFARLTTTTTTNSGNAKCQSRAPEPGEREIPPGKSIRNRTRSAPIKENVIYSACACVSVFEQTGHKKKIIYMCVCVRTAGAHVCAQLFFCCCSSSFMTNWNLPQGNENKNSCSSKSSQLFFMSSLCVCVQGGTGGPSALSFVVGTHAEYT